MSSSKPSSNNTKSYAVTKTEAKIPKDLTTRQSRVGRDRSPLVLNSNHDYVKLMKNMLKISRRRSISYSPFSSSDNTIKRSRSQVRGIGNVVAHTEEKSVVSVKNCKTLFGSGLPQSKLPNVTLNKPLHVRHAKDKVASNLQFSEITTRDDEILEKHGLFRMKNICSHESQLSEVLSKNLSDLLHGIGKFFDVDVSMDLDSKKEEWIIRCYQSISKENEDQNDVQREMKKDTSLIPTTSKASEEGTSKEVKAEKSQGTLQIPSVLIMVTIPPCDRKTDKKLKLEIPKMFSSEEAKNKWIKKLNKIDVAREIRQFLETDGKFEAAKQNYELSAFTYEIIPISFIN